MRTLKTLLARLLGTHPGPTGILRRVKRALASE
jgi:hypothetical protein